MWRSEELFVATQQRSLETLKNTPNFSATVNWESLISSAVIFSAISRVNLAKVVAETGVALTKINLGEQQISHML